MTMSEVDLPRIIVDRLEASYPAPAIFTADELYGWPTAFIEALGTNGLLQPASRAEYAMCDGCHWRCSKPVEFRGRGKAARAFIVCDEEPDLGRIAVPIDRLRQYRLSFSLLARFLHVSFGLTARAPLTGSPPLLLGRIKGRHGERSVSALLQDRVIVVQVGSHKEPVINFLKCGKGGMVANRALLKKLANRKDRESQSRPRYQPDKKKQKERTSETARRDRAIRKEAQLMQRKTGKTMSEISRDLAGLGRFRRTGNDNRPLTANRILRIIYER